MKKRTQKDTITKENKLNRLNSKIIEQAYQETKEVLREEDLSKFSSKNLIRQYYI